MIKQNIWLCLGKGRHFGRSEWFEETDFYCHPADKTLSYTGYGDDCLFFESDCLSCNCQVAAAPWWVPVNGADWRHPEGPDSDLKDRYITHTMYCYISESAPWMLPDITVQLYGSVRFDVQHTCCNVWNYRLYLLSVFTVCIYRHHRQISEFRWLTF